MTLFAPLFFSALANLKHDPASPKLSTISQNKRNTVLYTVTI